MPIILTSGHTLFHEMLAWPLLILKHGDTILVSMAPIAAEWLAHQQETTEPC